LSVPQFRTLGYLNRHAGASLSDVAEHIGLTLPSMSKLIEGLVERKLVARRVYSGDRRRVTLELSTRGRAVHQDAVSATGSFLAGRLALLSQRERAEVVRAMSLLRPLFAGERERDAEAELEKGRQD
jgi:DNA-binding MarR family transcriptional regulator